MLKIGSERCPHCGGDETNVIRGWRNAARIAASVALLPVYILGGLAGDHRGPVLPLERKCSACGRHFKERSVFQHAAGLCGRKR